MLNKLWNRGVRLRDKRRDADHVSSARWSRVKMPRPCFKWTWSRWVFAFGSWQFSLKGLAWLPGSAEKGGVWRMLVLYSRGGRLTGPPLHSEPLGAHDSSGMQLKSLLAYLPLFSDDRTALTLKLDPCVCPPRCGLAALGAMWHCYCLPPLTLLF